MALGTLGTRRVLSRVNPLKWLRFGEGSSLLTVLCCQRGDVGAGDPNYSQSLELEENLALRFNTSFFKREIPNPLWEKHAK